MNMRNTKRPNASARRTKEKTDVKRRGLMTTLMLGAVMPKEATAKTAVDDRNPLTRTQANLVIRALADMHDRDDPHLTQQIDDLIADMTQVLPEAPALLYLNRLYSRRTPHHVTRQDTSIDVMSLYEACAESNPVSFQYVDLKGAQTTRRVLPIEIVHQQNGILLLAWCEMRQAQRKFFLHAMTGLKIWPGTFAQERLALIEGAIEEAEARFYS